MERPSSEHLDTIEELVSIIENAEATIENIKQELNVLASHLGDSIEDREQLLKVVSYVYWTVPEIRSESLALSVTGKPSPHLMLPQLKSATFGVCPLCGEGKPISSRRQMKETILDERRRRRKGTLHEDFDSCYRDWRLCKTCSDRQAERNRQESSRRWKEREEAIKNREIAKKKRTSELRSMPYREYLKTPEWQATRTHQLRRAGYACQVCNAKGGLLNVHHRTYERRGNEAQEDLVVLCRGCHELFHREGKLAHH